MEFEISVVCKAKQRAGGMGSVKAIVAGAEKAFGGRVIEEFATGFIIIADDDGLDGLSGQSISFAGLVYFDIRSREQQGKFVVVWLDTICFEEGGGKDARDICFDREII